ncbi:DNA topoisomerase IV, A subunit [Caldalkalibacillus thermarum TA2.A1]|uniref:DNA topoisomerase 4 subunit A n=1 Tax=Caldalkalibacillus thermarum (strain TA2.A1) TaxID=986075 RepID=F5L8U4_CALTT|nr:DNA topoisomerase IV subunit A [Caldalkalibacillus thermarum]EGL82226.1 DNA topoisomerase IV, A subunit [Caldalkalibacillus thermarum TA2.A1]
MSVLEKFLDLPFEEIISDRFGRYSKYIIQDRALPDVRDGLKPVQRRILYAMFKEGNTHDNPFRKSAKTVGTVIGNYHPHGDASVYDALVRMSQDWKMRHILVEMHGNNGSMDGDPQAAMRYTEARLSSIAAEMLRDIDRETVPFAPNFDDTTQEPTVLPARFPNLLVNGSTGISAGYATEIPPHPLGEVIDAVLMQLDNPSVTVDELMTVLRGPDFPTGGIIQGIDGIRQAYQTGKGKIVLRAKASFEVVKGGREQIVITEIPYEVNKAQLVRKIDECRLDRKVEGIAEVRDETDRSGLRIVIELKKDADAEGVLHYLYKHTDLQISYNFNMVAIHNKTPKLLNLKQLLQAYIDHQKEVVKRRSQYDLAKAREREHVVQGLIKAISILDDVIATIRASKNKADAKENLMAQFGFTEQQAEAIVTLQLYRLTNTDISQLEKEAQELKHKIEELEAILGSEARLIDVIKTELVQIKEKYADRRRTEIQEEIEELNINLEVLVPSENVMVTVTRDGYVKRTSLRSYAASNGEEAGMKEGDELLFLYESNTTHTLLLFTNKGRYLYLPVHELPDIRWKELGQHISNLIPIDKDERIIAAHNVIDFAEDERKLLFFTRQGMVKKTALAEYEVQRYSKPLVALKLKAGDELLDVRLTTGHEDIMIGTQQGYLLWFSGEEVSEVGQKAQGVKGINLKEGDEVVTGYVIPEGEKPVQIQIETGRGALRSVDLAQVEKMTRARRGTALLKRNSLTKVKDYLIFTEQDELNPSRF